MSPVPFGGSERGTLGLEWELALVDLETRELSGRAHEVLDAVGATDDGPIRGEYLATMVELVSGVHPRVGDAVAAGGVLPAQADAITSVLADLPADLPAEAVRAGEGTMIGLAGSHHGVELRRLSGHLLEVLAPDVAEGHEAARLERELAAARKNRHLAFFRESGRVSFRRVSDGLCGRGP